MKITISILAVFSSLIYLICTTFEAYSTIETGVDNYACQTYDPPIDCFRR